MTITLDGTNGITAPVYQSTAGLVVQSAAGTIQLAPNGVPAVTVDTAGNVGVGVTPSAWGGTYAGSIQMKNNGFISNNTSTDLHVGTNAYYNGTSWLYQTASYASMYEQFNGVHYWLVAPSGTAGSAVPLTQAMTLDNGGNLFIGRTSAPSGAPVSPAFYTGSLFANIATTIGGYSAILNIQHSGGAYNGIMLQNGSTTISQAISFINSSNSEVGSVTVGTTSTGFNTTSDQRLKTNIADAAPATESFMMLQFRQFDWVATGDHQDYGGVAQEMQSIAPEVVTIPANSDAIWSVDWSKLVPRMGKALQEAIARVSELEARLTAAGL